jgi:hypothetical protein
VDEDICGTGLEAKWLIGKASGRASLVSVNFEEFESPSAIRQRRRLRSDSPVRSASTAATQAPPPLNPPPTTELPSPAAAVAAERMFADTELHGAPAEPNRKKVVLVTGAALGVLLILGLVVALSGSSKPGMASPPLPPSAASDLAAAAAHAAPADAPAAVSAPRDTTAPDVSAPIAPQANTRTAQTAGDAETAGVEAAAAVRSKPSTSPTVQRKAPRKEAEKALTKPQDAPKLDLKKPY